MFSESHLSNISVFSVCNYCCCFSAGDPSALVVLVEEELVVIDLQTEGWPVIQTPYLVPLHSSAITCSHHISAIPLKLWERVIAAGELQNTHYSKKVQMSTNNSGVVFLLFAHWLHRAVNDTAKQ